MQYFPALPCRHLITGHSKCVLMWVCVFLRPHFTPLNTFQVQEDVLPPTPTADHQSRSIKVAVSQLTALCRKRIRVSGGGYSQLWARGKATHLVQQVLREKLTLALLSVQLHESVTQQRQTCTLYTHLRFHCI